MSSLFSRTPARDTAPSRPARRFGRLVRTGVAATALAVLGVGANAVVSPAPASAATIGCVVDVVAHPDDDLFFQNPAIRNDIVGRKCVSTVYVTSGDGGQGVAYARTRESGVRAAYAKMAGVPNLWLTLPVKIGAQTVTSSMLLLAPQVTLTFLRLPDGNPDGGGTTASGYQSLQRLYLGQIPTLKTLDSPVQTYTSTSLVATLGSIMSTLRASTVRTLDQLGDFNEGDHSDHYTVARYAAVARAAYAPTASLVGYLGYPSSTLPANVAGAELTAKRAAFQAYAPFDTAMCPNPATCDSDWIVRQHLATEIHAVPQVTPGNVAPVATLVSASSQNSAEGQTAKKAVDGVIDGYPGDGSAEWSTAGGRAGSWLQLNWTEPVQLDTVMLYDRPNAGDQVTGGTLTFSDGTKVAVPALDNAGAPVTVTFPARTTTSLKFTATSVSATTANVGLAELQAWTSGSAPTTPSGPVTTTPTQPPAQDACATPTTATVPSEATPSTMPNEPTDVAAGASVTASAENAGTQQTAGNVVDGRIDGYPGDYTAEWAAPGCGVGTWVQLTWPTPVTLDTIVLFDRPNANDQITAGSLTFSDGSTVTVPTLANDGTATSVGFSARTVTSVRLTVTGVSATTGNVGLAEMQAWTAKPASQPVVVTQPAVDLAPSATSSTSAGTAADGVGSWAQLTWAQSVTAGRVVLSNPTNGSLGVTAAVLSFSDGSTVRVPALPAAGQSVTVTFTPRATTTLRVTATAVSGSIANSAQAKLQVFAG